MDLEDANFRGTPVGCLVGFLALIPLCIAGIGGYGLWMAQRMQPSPKTEQFREVMMSSVRSGLIAGVPLVIVAIWIFKRSRGQSSR